MKINFINLLFKQMATIYFFLFSLVGVLIPYLSTYLSGIGYDSKTIGMIISIVGITRIFAPVLWSKISLSPKKTMLLASSMSLFCLTIMLFIKNSYYFYFVFFIFNFFYSAILPRVELISLNRSKTKYAKVRKWGSVGYIIATIVTSLIINQYGSGIYLYILILINFLLILPIFRIKDDITERKQLLRNWHNNKHLWSFLLVTFLIQASHGPYYAFFIPFANKLGWSITWSGIMLSIGVVAEIVVFSVMSYLIKKFRLNSLFLLFIFLTIVRWLIFAQFANYVIILWLAIILHGASFAAIHALSMQWILHNVAINNQSRVQALYSGLGFGGGGALGAAIAGLLWNDGNNSTITFYFAISCVVIAFIIFIGVINNRK